MSRRHGRGDLVIGDGQSGLRDRRAFFV